MRLHLYRVSDSSSWSLFYISKPSGLVFAGVDMYIRALLPYLFKVAPISNVNASLSCQEKSSINKKKSRSSRWCY
jgi:hypothetical protein